MSDITLEKTHALLEKLADYVMTEIPAIKEKLDQKANKADLDQLENKVNLLLDGMDAQAQQLDILRTDMKAVSGTLDLHEERLGSLEEHTFGHRVRDDKNDYRKA